MKTKKLPPKDKRVESAKLGEMVNVTKVKTPANTLKTGKE